MELKEAVRTAKLYVAELFAEEGVSDLLLEEVEFEPEQKVWRVTIGFQRPVVRDNPMSIAFPPRRSYKVITISDDQSRVLSLREREGMH